MNEENTELGEETSGATSGAEVEGSQEVKEANPAQEDLFSDFSWDTAVEENGTAENGAEVAQEEELTPATTPDELAQAQAQIAQMQAQMQAMQAQVQAQTQAPAPAQEAAPADGVAGIYANLAIPDEIVEAIRSDDPAQAAQGMQQLGQGLAVTIHNQVAKDFEKKLAEMQTVIPTVMAQEKQKKEIESDFYGQFPQLAHESFRALVGKHANYISQNPLFANKGWTPELRNAIAQSVYAELGWGQPAAQAQTKAKPVTTTSQSAPNTFAPGGGGAFAQTNQKTDINAPDQIAGLWKT